MQSPIINVDELLAIHENEGLIIIDTSNGKNAYEDYRNLHLGKAIFIDLNTQLSSKSEDLASGGRHPLPSIHEFCTLLGEVGVDSSSHIIIYDNNYGANAAARLWWMLRSIGHQKVQVLNGGFQQAVAQGFPTQSGVINLPKTTVYKADGWRLPLSNILEVAEVVIHPDWAVIDVRDSARYNGEIEPIDLVAGHIPGAINFPFINNLDSDGFFLKPEILYQNYHAVFTNYDCNKVIVHCGSGVTACHTLLAMDYAGLPIPKLYVGSWSEWSRSSKDMITQNQ